MTGVNALRVIALVANDKAVTYLSVEYYVTEAMTAYGFAVETEGRVSFVSDRAFVYPAVGLLFDFYS